RRALNGHRCSHLALVMQAAQQPPRLLFTTEVAFLDRDTDRALDDGTGNRGVLPLIVAALDGLLANRRDRPANRVRLLDHHGLGDGPHHGIPAFLVHGLVNRPLHGVATFAAFGLVDGPLHGVATFAALGLVNRSLYSVSPLHLLSFHDRTHHGVAPFCIHGLVDGPLHGVATFAVLGLVHWFHDSVLALDKRRFPHRPGDGVVFRLVGRAVARLHHGDGFRLVDGFVNRLVDGLYLGSQADHIQLRGHDRSGRTAVACSPAIGGPRRRGEPSQKRRGRAGSEAHDFQGLEHAILLGGSSGIPVAIRLTWVYSHGPKECAVSSLRKLSCSLEGSVLNGSSPRSRAGAGPVRRPEQHHEVRVQFLHKPRRSHEILSRSPFVAVEYTTIEACNEPSRTVYHWLLARLVKLRDFLKFQVALCRSQQVDKLTRLPANQCKSTRCANRLWLYWPPAAINAAKLARPARSKELSPCRGRRWSARRSGTGL